MIDIEAAKEKLESNIFLTGAILAPLLLGVFYLIGECMRKVEAAHTKWVEEENRKAEWAGETRKRQ